MVFVIDWDFVVTTPKVIVISIDWGSLTAVSTTPEIVYSFQNYASHYTPRVLSLLPEVSIAVKFTAVSYP